jgi:hypothetical protein
MQLELGSIIVEKSMLMSTIHEVEREISHILVPGFLGDGWLGRYINKWQSSDMGRL